MMSSFPRWLGVAGWHPVPEWNWPRMRTFRISPSIPASKFNADIDFISLGTGAVPQLLVGRVLEVACGVGEVRSKDDALSAG